MLISHMGVRSRMLAMITAAMLPLVVLTAIGLLLSYDEADQSARDRLAFEARSGASEFARAFEDAKATLTLLRNVPELAAADRPTCDAFLAQFANASELFLTLGVIDAGGDLICHSKTHAKQAFGDQDLAHRVLEGPPQGFETGRFMIGPVSKRPTVAVAMQLTSKPGDPPRAIFGSLNLDWLEGLAERLSGPDHHTIALIDPATERVLVRWPNTVQFGTAFPGHPLIAELRSHSEGGTTDSIGFDHVPRFYGFAPIGDTNGKSLQVAIGSPQEVAFASVSHRTRWAIMIAVITVLVAVVLTWWIAEITQIRPINRLTKAANRIGDGNFHTSAGIETWQAGEFRHLGETLDMAATQLAAAHEADEIIAASERRFRLMADNTADLITCVGRDGRRTFVSGASKDMLGYEPAELLGQDPSVLVVDEDRPIVRQMMESLIDGHGSVKARYRVHCKDGRAIHVEVSGRPIPDGSGYVCAMRDVSERQAVEDRLAEANAQLAALAATDELTGLANRREFNRVLSQEVARSLREGTSLSLLMIDVDRFKAYNDHYGHPSGDACLRQIASAIGLDLHRPSDLAARYGGEEFAAILPLTCPDSACDRAEAIRQAVRDLQLEHAGSEKGIVTISIGVSTFCARGRHTLKDLDLVVFADEALYTAKSAGRDRVCSKHIGYDAAYAAL